MQSNNPKKIVVATSGGFDPVHIGHVRLFKESKALGTELVVIINNDNWLRKKKGFVFMPQNERKEVIEAITYVDKVILSDHLPNPDDMSVSKEIEKLRPNIFANGGDRSPSNTPEDFVCRNIGCKMAFNIGAGAKVQSSSWLTNSCQNISKYANNFEEPNIKRPWGGYTVLNESQSYWVKKLYVTSQARLSLQSHELRTEVWVVLYGSVICQIGNTEQKGEAGDYFFVPAKSKHRISALKDACLLEVAFGQVLESDIERFEDDYGRAHQPNYAQINL